MTSCFPTSAGNRAELSCVAAAERKRGRRAFPFRERGLESHMRRLCSAQQTRRARADTEFRDRSGRGIAQERIVREPEIIIRRKVNQLIADEIDLRALRRTELAQFSMKRLRAQRLQLLVKKFAHRTSAPREGYIQSAQERSAAESCQTFDFASPSTTAMTSRPGREPLEMRQCPAASV